ncbi:MAG: GNAT family N-acetyltransferase, partial [Roseburia sp.]|nr:GNAT family N-acetyltransferase [Roseburia sp.]
LNKDLSYGISDEYSISPQDFKIDNWKYQLVIHKGFNHEGIPERLDDKFFEPTPNEISALKVFALNKGEYCAHCGVWYTKGDTAYIEPVVTVPQHRERGLAKAVIYEAVRRAKTLGANRATVLSDQAFYYRIGFECSSEVYCWKK